MYYSVLKQTDKLIHWINISVEILLIKFQIKDAKVHHKRKNMWLLFYNNNFFHITHIINCHNAAARKLVPGTICYITPSIWCIFLHTNLGNCGWRYEHIADDAILLNFLIFCNMLIIIIIMFDTAAPFYNIWKIENLWWKCQDNCFICIWWWNPSWHIFHHESSYKRSGKCFFSSSTLNLIKMHKWDKENNVLRQHSYF